MSVAAGACDQEARDMALSAINKIQSHEQVCAQRWLNAMQTMGDIKRILAWALTVAVGTLISMIGFMAAHILH